jgi:CPA1 family monovalent cation:H+ antiporter
MPTDAIRVEPVVWMLVIGAGVAMAVRYIRLPYTIALVLAGLAVGAGNFLPRIELTKGLVFAVFLPPLLFEATLNTELDLLRRNGMVIGVLAVIGVVLAASLVAVAGWYALGFPIVVAALFGVLISPTDPVSVLAVLRDLHVPRRLAVVMEGESLFNDGTAAVLFTIFAAMLPGATAYMGPAGVVGEFVKEVAGGAVVGVMVGLLIRLLLAQVDDHLIEITLTTIAAYGSYMLAGTVHVSGVIAVIAAGITVGTVRSQRVMSSVTRLAVYTFWEYFAFFINSIVFLLIGIDIRLEALAHRAPEILLAYGAVVLARAISIYVIGAAFSRTQWSVPFSWRHLLVWGGLRGSISMALALALAAELRAAPAVAQHAPHIVTITFGVVLLSLLVQGLTLSPFVRALGLAAKRGVDLETAYTVRLRGLEAAGEELQLLREVGRVSPPVAEKLARENEAGMADVEAKLRELYDAAQSEAGESAGQEQESAAVSRMRAAQRAVIRRAEKDGILTRELARSMLEELSPPQPL